MCNSILCYAGSFHPSIASVYIPIHLGRATVSSFSFCLARKVNQDSHLRPTHLPLAGEWMNKREAAHRAQGGKTRGPLFAALWNQFLIAGLPQTMLVKVHVQSGWRQGLQQALSLSASSSNPKMCVPLPALCRKHHHLLVQLSRQWRLLISGSRNKVYLLMRDCKAGDRALVAANATPHILLWGRPASAFIIRAWAFSEDHSVIP